LSAWDIALMRRDPKLRRIFRPSESDKDFTVAARSSFQIHRAIDAHDEDLALAELGSPGNLEAAKFHGVTPLMMAARTGSLRIVKALLDRGAALGRRSEHGCTAVSIAAEEGHMKVLKALLWSDQQEQLPMEQLLAPDIFGTGPLMRACENGNTEAVRLLLRHTTKKECNAPNQKGWTALLLASYNGFADVVELLLAHGAKAEVGRFLPTKRAIYTPLCYACLTGRVDCVALLLDAHITLEAQRAPLALKLAQDGGHELCADQLRVAGVGDEAEGASAPAPADVAKRGRRPSTANDEAIARAPAESAVPATAEPISRAAQLEAIEEKEAELLHMVSELIAKIDDLKAQTGAVIDDNASLSKARAEQAKDARDDSPAARGPKPAWAFSPSGKWTPGLWATKRERGGSISCEYGEPAHSTAWVGAHAPPPPPPGEQNGSKASQESRAPTLVTTTSAHALPAPPPGELTA